MNEPVMRGIPRFFVDGREARIMRIGTYTDRSGFPQDHTRIELTLKESDSIDKVNRLLCEAAKKAEELNEITGKILYFCENQADGAVCSIPDAPVEEKEA